MSALPYDGLITFCFSVNSLAMIGKVLPCSEQQEKPRIPSLGAWLCSEPLFSAGFLEDLGTHIYTFVCMPALFITTLIACTTGKRYTNPGK